MASYQSTDFKQKLKSIEDNVVMRKRKKHNKRIAIVSDSEGEDNHSVDDIGTIIKQDISLTKNPSGLDNDNKDGMI